MKIYIYILMILLTVAVVSCQIKEPKDEGIVLASVNDLTLTLEELQASYGHLEWENFTLEEQRKIIDNWIDMTLLGSYAKKNENIAADLSLKFMVKNAANKIYANALISEALDHIEISNDDLWNYYRLRQAEFVEQLREYRVQRIYVATEAEMNQVKKMIDDKDITFVNAAIQYSTEGIGQNGGYMGSFVTKSSPDSLLWKELSKKERFYEVLMPYRNGWLIARWYEFRTATSNSSFYDVRDDIDRRLREEKRQTVYEQMLREARINASVTKEF
ncbi:MAG: hypothetical protein FWG20_01635 [Candidatus Cloacimonetes bacterium]|nr:hypothetical protein [Candidatus Cloacimonadota bacterium]